SVIDPSCSSGYGFLGVERYVKRHRPKMVLLENVRSLFEKRQVEGGDSAYEIVRRRLAKLGYAVSGAVYNTADFGLPQQRNRAWLLCVLESELATSESQLEKDMNLFRRHCTPMSKCVDLSATFEKEPQERKPGKPGKPDAKWRDALDQQFDIYGKELARLQGVGCVEWSDYRMGEESPALIRSFIGNAFSAPINLAALASVLANWNAEASQV
ncbi:Modification methylase HaeII (M.HaeII) (Cytosine-specific methyltransferase HaeII), partial [Durusdinium trenchii]